MASFNVMPAPYCGRRLRCAHQRMQLVVMTTVLALAGASKLCSSGCSLQVYTIPVESCNKTEYVDTTLCAGQCYNEVLESSKC